MAYEKPIVMKLGSLAELTRQTIKQLGGSDGFLFQNGEDIVPIGNVS